MKKLKKILNILYLNFYILFKLFFEEKRHLVVGVASLNRTGPACFSVARIEENYTEKNQKIDICIVILPSVNKFLETYLFQILEEFKIKKLLAHRDFNIRWILCFKLINFFTVIDLVTIERTTPFAKNLSFKLSAGRKDKLLDSFGLSPFKYICIHQRNEFFLSRVDSRKNWNYHSHRNFQAQVFLLLIRAAENFDLKVVEFGNSKSELSDYGFRNYILLNDDKHSGELDLVLNFYSLFYLGSDSGAADFASILNKNLFFINLTYLRVFETFRKDLLTPFTPKLFECIRCGLFLDIWRSKKLRLFDLTNSLTLKKYGLRAIPNSNLDTLNLFGEIVSQFDFKQKIYIQAKHSEMQKRFVEVMNWRNDFNFKKSLTISKSFVESHAHWLEVSNPLNCRCKVLQ